MTNASDTPRTDAQAGYEDGSGGWVYRDDGGIVPAFFARTLERELAAKSAEVERLREELAQASNEAWDAAYHRAQTEWADRVIRLTDALEHLIERCDTSDDFRYGTLSTSFVRDVASEALAEAK